MATEAYLVCHERRLAFDCGKFAGMWITQMDWRRTDEATFAKRVLDVWIGPDGEYEQEHDTVGSLVRNQRVMPGLARDYAARLAKVLFRFCSDCDWKVVAVQDDWFFDNAMESPNKQISANSYQLVGSRWDECQPLGLGYDLDPRPEKFR